MGFLNMCERVEIIKNFYDNLEYDEIERTMVFAEIATLSKEVEGFTVDTSFLDRFLTTISIIEKNLPLFQSACEHVDIITTILKYLNNFALKYMYRKLDILEMEEEILSIMYTLFNVCTECEIQSFLENCIIKNSKLDTELSLCRKLKNHLLYETNEIIILEDSDLYAVVNYFKRSKNIRLYNVWVQEPIKHKFWFLINKYCGYFTPNFFSVFRSKQELLTSAVANKINLLSIWTEDITFAKNLAATLDRDVIFINAHMDLCGGTVLLPYLKIVDENLLKFFQVYDEENVKSLIYKDSFHYLFYNGMWQKPEKSPYLDIRLNENHIGDRTQSYLNDYSANILNCLKSAAKGVTIWSNMSTDSRMKILFNFVHTLECNGKLHLAVAITSWLKASNLYENVQFYSQSGRLEIKTIRKPKGIIILKEENEMSLFRHLTQALVIGNCIIVITDAKCGVLTSYCDMFSTSKIPPGVINVLSSENIEDVLNMSKYNDYEEKLFSHEEPEIIFTNLTVPKKIVLPLN